ncbi:MAG: FecR family protein, partial [Methylococcaceae bacterium]
GDPVYVDETIETSAGGHVHLRFVDEATISLRPNSRLSIELYHYDKLQPQNSAIRFNFEAGVVRSISGKATEAAHDRFRLNTPITAIGVLGTDFVVRAESEKMWAGVYSGAIAIAPLNSQCSANGLGACAGATRLSEAMGSVMLEFGGRREKEKMVPFDAMILSKASHSDADKINQSADSFPVTSGRITVAEIKATDVAIRLDNASHLVIDSPVPVIDSPVPTQPPAFVWARWGSQLPGDTLSQPYAVAQTGRDVTIGDRYFALFRSPVSLTELDPRAGVYDFKLTQGQVYFVGNGISSLPQVSTLARLDAATLQVDFAQRQFATHLEMSYPQAGAAAINLSGPIQNSGIFTAQDAASKVAGALSLDGAKAGMLFQSQIQSGTFHGLTAWTK